LKPVKPVRFQKPDWFGPQVWVEQNDSIFLKDGIIINIKMTVYKENIISGVMDKKEVDSGYLCSCGQKGGCFFTTTYP